MSEQLIRLIMFAGGLFIGMFGGVVIMSLMTMAKISDLHEEIRVLNALDSGENGSMSEHE